MHVGCTEKIVIRDIDVLAAGTWLRTNKQPRLIYVVHAIEMVCRLGNAGRALEIIEGEGCRVTVERTIDIGGTESQERARQALEAGEIDRLITRTARDAGCPRWRVDHKLLGPSVPAISRQP